MNSFVLHLESLVSFLKPKSHTWLTSELSEVTLKAETMRLSKCPNVLHMIYKIIDLNLCLML